MSGLQNTDATDTVLSGGLATGTVLSATGFADTFEFVSAGGVVTGTTIGADTTQFVFGAASGTTVESGGAQDVFGVANGVTVSSGGEATIGAGAVASDVTVSSGGYVALAAGTTTTGIAVSAGGYVAVMSGAVAGNTVIGSGGSLTVRPGALASDVVISSGGIETVESGGVTSNVAVMPDGTLNLEPGGSAYGTSTGSAGSAADVLIYSGGVLVSSASGVVSGVVVSGSAMSAGILSGGTLVDATVEDGAQVTVSSGGTLIVDSAGGGYDGITLMSGGAIDVADATATASLSGDVLTVTAGAVSWQADLSGDYTQEYFHISSSGDGGTLITVDGTPCYCRGTLILTDAGEVAVEDLRIGDRVMTLAGEARAIRWIGRRRYARQFAAGNRDILPVVIRAGALGDELPRRDLSVSPLHAMYLDGVLVPALALVNGRTIVQAEQIDEVAYFHVELESHDILIAEGTASESFVDDGSRGMFHNAGEYDGLYPEAVGAPAMYCAPRVEEGEALAAIRARLNRGLADGSEAGAVSVSGYVDAVERHRITGWARVDGDTAPVRLQILDRGVTIGEVVANRARPDLGARCGFCFEVSGGLSPLERHVIEVRRVASGAQALGNTPWILDIDGNLAGAVLLEASSGVQNERSGVVMRMAG
nr:Hint domain-containing protein [Acetobacter oeni]